MSLKNRPVATILASAYLSAMLTSSLAPIRNNTIFAAAVDPAAAEKALQNAVSGLDVAGWAAAAQPPKVAEPNAVAVPSAPTQSEPVMDEELMNRLITRTLASKKPAKFSARLSKIIGISDGTADIPVLQVSEPVPEGKHLFIVPTQADSKDVIIVFKRADNAYAEYYLTDKSGILRAAAIWDSNGIRLITNEQAAEKYKAELKLFAKLAQELPPAGTAVAGNS